MSWDSTQTTSRSLSVSTPNSVRRSKPPRASSTRMCAAAPSQPLSTSTPPAKAVVIESAIAMQDQAIAWRHAGDDIGVAPTIGALHGGHDSLVARARRGNQRGVVRILVHPAQVRANEDCKNYPPPLDQERAPLEAAGGGAPLHPHRQLGVRAAV